MAALAAVAYNWRRKANRVAAIPQIELLESHRWNVRLVVGSQSLPDYHVSGENCLWLGRKFYGLFYSLSFSDLFLFFLENVHSARTQVFTTSSCMLVMINYHIYLYKSYEKEMIGHATVIVTGSNATTIDDLR